MKERRATILLVIMTLMWGSSYLFMKLGLDTIQPFNLVALRFCLGFVALIPFLPKRLKGAGRALYGYSIVLGVIIFAMFACMTIALQTTSASNTGFLLALSVVLVPLFECVFTKKRPNGRIIAGVLLALVGIGLLTINGQFKIGFGDLLCIVAALLYTAHIMITDRAVRKVDSFAVGSLQLGVAGVLSLGFTFAFESPVLPSGVTAWVSVLILALVCTALGFVVQPIAQRHVSPTRTGLIFSLEPLFAALFAMIFMGEMLSVAGYIGAAAMLTGIFVAELKPKEGLRLGGKAPSGMEPGTKVIESRSGE